MDKMSEDDLNLFLENIDNVHDYLESFDTKEEAIEVLMEQTGLPKEVIEAAYKFYIG